MSVTFYIATADSTLQRLDYDDGEESLNLANVNARALLRTVGLPEDDEGTGVIPTACVPEAVRKAVRALNTRAGRQQLVRPTTSTTRFHDLGTSEEYAERVLREFVKFLARAATLGRAVYWA